MKYFDPIFNCLNLLLIPPSLLSLLVEKQDASNRFEAQQQGGEQEVKTNKLSP